MEKILTFLEWINIQDNTVTKKELIDFINKMASNKRKYRKTNKSGIEIKKLKRKIGNQDIFRIINNVRNNELMNNNFQNYKIAKNTNNETILSSSTNTSNKKIF